MLNLFTELTAGCSEASTRKSRPAVSIAFCGINKASRKSLLFLFASQQAFDYRIVEDRLADIHIIDIDDELGRQTWESLNRSSQETALPVILLGKAIEPKENVLTLNKPFQPGQLLEELQTLWKRHQSVTPSYGHSHTREGHSLAQDDIDLEDPDARSRMEFTPEEYLAHHLQQLMAHADKKNKYICLACCDVDFYIDPFNQEIRTLVKEENLRIFGTMALSNSNLRIKRLSRLPEQVLQEGSRYPFTEFLWKMIIAATRGRIPTNTNLDQAFILNKRPSLELFNMLDHGVQIGALWSSSAKSIRELILMSGLPYREIFTFFSVTIQLGLLQPVDPRQNAVIHKTSRAASWCALMNWRRRFFNRSKRPEKESSENTAYLNKTLRT